MGSRSSRSAALVLFVSAAFCCGRSFAQDAAKKPFFLPRSPAAAAYVLGRLSNQELIAAPRSEFVYVALLQRNALERKYRLEAMDGLAKIRGTDPLRELIRGIIELDKKGESSEPVLRDLGTLLLQREQNALQAMRPDFEKLRTGQLPRTRQLSWAVVVTLDHRPD